MIKKDKKVNNIILHIPHTNAMFPDDMGELLVDLDTLIAFSNQISDIGINELFSHNIGVKYIAPFSRIYCDVEKFIDDENEVMSKYGQGVFYTKDCKGNVFRRINQDYKDRILESYYFPYHKGLDELTLSLLDKRLIIVDCHSYDEECVQHNKTESYEDICLGYDEQYYSKKLVDGVRDIFVKNGFSVSYNTPYEGTLIPNAIYDKNIPEVFCIMIEINKRVYMLNKLLNDKCKDTIKKVLDYLVVFND
ncbi:MAG: N-formylglutamate amidohydrolase [Bacilli bacterium]|jgi:N-formylglutamate amidohydrolase